MKKTKLKILFTSLGFFALSSTFAQVDTSKAVTTDSANVSVPVPQGSPVATDSTSMNQSYSANQRTDSTSAGYDKADKKRLKAAKKEAKAEAKEAGK